MAAPTPKTKVRFQERAELLDFLLDVSAATSETLEFLAGGTQQYGSNNEPAFALMDNLKITQTTPSATPEPRSTPTGTT